MAPKKPMLCVSFLLPKGVEALERVNLEDYEFGIKREEPKTKKPRTK